MLPLPTMPRSSVALAGHRVASGARRIRQRGKPRARGSRARERIARGGRPTRADDDADAALAR